MARLVLAALLLIVPPASAQVLPPNFDLVPLPGSFDRPVGLAFTPDGALLVIEQRGLVRYHDGAALQSAPFLDLRDEVNFDGDRGLLGIALHPGFVADGGDTSWVYLLYTVSPVPGMDYGFDQDGKYSFSRLTRYKAIMSGTDVVADASSRHILLGRGLADGSVPDCIASLHNSHSNGSLHFADDGSLLVATGDGAHFDFNDMGGADPEGFDDFVHPVSGLKGPTPLVQDSGSFRSQDVRSLAGKILRIHPGTGHGYPSNPFYDGDPTSNASRVWALGLRNPYRVLMFPATGASDPAAGSPNTLAIGDVGHAAWEEMDVCRGGENFGWPCFEAFLSKDAFQSFDPPDPEFPNCNSAMAGALKSPIAAWHHFASSSYKPPGTYVDESGAPLAGFAGQCAIGGTLYTGGSYPEIYNGRIFFADYGSGWIKTIELDASYAVTAIKPFAASVGLIVAIERHPITGDLYVVKVSGVASVSRLRFSPAKPYGCGLNPEGSLTLSSAVQVGALADFALHNPFGTQSPGAFTGLGLAVMPDPAYPCGSRVPGLGMAGPFALGELLIATDSSEAFTTVAGPVWTGVPATITVGVPDVATLVGKVFFAQGMIVDPTFGGGSGAGLGLTEALSVVIGS